MAKNELKGLGDALGFATGVGLEVACWIAMGIGLGRGIDVLICISPIGTVLGILAGVAFAMRSIYHRLLRMKS